MRKIADVLQYGKIQLQEHKINPREARLLLAHSMGIATDELIKYTQCEEEQFHLFDNALRRRTQGEPFAYIIGIKEFMKLPFKVNEHTLIPREETEILVQQAINILSDEQHTSLRKVLDMCTGSGCIAISLAKYTKHCQIDAVDVSKEALCVAKENAKTHQVDVHFIESNLFEKVEKKYDLIVSNPPYIASDEIKELQVEVQIEPHIALDGGKDGLDFYRKIAKESISHLNKDGWLLLEIGFDQADAVMQILKEFGYQNIEIKKDLSGNDRVIVANCIIEV